MVEVRLGFGSSCGRVGDGGLSVRLGDFLEEKHWLSDQDINGISFFGIYSYQNLSEMVWDLGENYFGCIEGTGESADMVCGVYVRAVGVDIN